MLLFSRLYELFEDWNYLIQRDGIISGLHSIGFEIARLPYKHLRLLVLAYPLLEPLLDSPPKVVLDIRIFTSDDIDFIRKMDCPSEAKLCIRRLEQGHFGLIAFAKSQPVGYAWGCTKVDPKLERVRLTLEPGDIYCAYAYTAPSFRRQGVQTSLTIERLKIFRDMGFRRAITMIDIHNTASLAVWQRKLNGLIIGYIDFIRIGPYYHVRYLESQSIQEYKVVGTKIDKPNHQKWPE